MSWEKIILGNFIKNNEIDIQTGPFGTQLKAADYTEHGIPVINVRNIGYGNLRAQKLEYVPDDVASRLSQHTLEENDIVFGRKGSVDRHLLVKQDQVGWIQGSDCIRLRVETDRINAKFLSYALNLDNHKQWILIQCSNKATMASLNHEVIARISLKIPDVSTQKNIARIFSNYDDLIENNRRRIQLLEESARLLYKEWFVHLRFPGHEHVKVVDGVPEGWYRVLLTDVCIDIKDSVNPEAIDSSMPYIGFEHMPRRSITLDTWETASKVTSNKFLFKENDIIFGKIRPYFHKIGFTLCSGVTSSDAVVIRPLSQDLYFYCLMHLSSDYFIALASKTVKEGSKMPRADWKYLLTTDLLLPTDTLLRDFNEQIEPITKQLKALSLQNQALVKARDLLLPKLMSGEIVV
ncbi:restriction endonuclease subunit S [Thiothrix litoralis]|uniref:Restriction endonuclease subunit S n=1 Tax=Thiothrix litoralis TaxID=2891210 RepID=A0ABX7WSX8_9GAMM|nr:restriction endonuclease subunit S [Thiothrix litoralis]QTR45598.1 restriction endonuclease subunit S [Thiothrix litoralis]